MPVLCFTEHTLTHGMRGRKTMGKGNLEIMDTSRGGLSWFPVLSAVPHGSPSAPRCHLSGAAESKDDALPVEP